MKVRKMTGSEWGALGVLISFMGALCAWYGTRVSGKEAKERVETQLALTQKVADSNLELKEKADEVSSAQKQLRAQSDEIAKLNRELAEQSARFTAYMLGTGSYIYLHVENFGTPAAKATIRHVGENPVRKTEVLVFDITDRIPLLVTRQIDRYTEAEGGAENFKGRVDESYPDQARKLTVNPFAPAAEKETAGFFVYISGANGTIRQVFQFIKVGDTWRQAYKVQRVAGTKKYKPLGEYFDKEFPVEGLVMLRPDPTYPDYDGKRRAN